VIAAGEQLTVLFDRAVEIDVGLAEQACLELADEDVELTPGGEPGMATCSREPVPGLGERKERGASSGLMSGEHRAHPAFAVNVGAHNDPLVRFDPLEHGLSRRDRQAVDRETQALDEPRASVMAI
jgi:hypothetical protein